MKKLIPLTLLLMLLLSINTWAFWGWGIFKYCDLGMDCVFRPSQESAVIGSEMRSCAYKDHSHTYGVLTSGNYTCHLTQNHTQSFTPILFIQSSKRRVDIESPILFYNLLPIGEKEIDFDFPDNINFDDAGFLSIAVIQAMRGGYSFLDPIPENSDLEVTVNCRKK